MKIIVAHPDKQHSYQLATALKRKNILCKYITTVYDRPESITNKIKKILKGNSLKKANTRSCKELDNEDIVQFCELNNLIIILLAKIPQLRDLCRKLRLLNAKHFGVKVAKYAIRNNVDAVIMYDTTAFSCFKYLENKAPHIKRILDVTIITRPYMKKIFEEEYIRSKDENIKKENLYLWNNEFMKKFEREIRISDYFLSASEIVSRSIIFCGIEREKIIHVPYGVEVEKFKPINIKKANTILKLIVVGQLNRRKGIHNLLSVVSEYTKKEVVLELVGGFETTSDLYIKYNKYDNIKFLGFLTHDDLIKHYQNADVFVLPSLAEGLALVGLEAMACGLTIICSTNTGVNDAVKDYENGFVINVGDEKQLKEKIDFFINNPQAIHEMGKKARITAENYTWNRYKEAVANDIISIIGGD